MQRSSDAQLIERLAALESENEALRDELHSKARLLDILQATDVMLVLLDPGFDFVWVNRAYAATCRMAPDEMVGRNHFALYPNAENEAIFRQVHDSGKAVFYKDKPFVFPDQPERGTTYWDWSLVPVKNERGAVTGLVFSLRETTRHKRAELALAERENLLRTIIESTPDAIFVLDRGHRVRYLNNITLELVRRSRRRADLRPTDVVGLVVEDVFGQGDLAAILRAQDEETMTTGRATSLEETIDTEGGPMHRLTVRTPLLDATGAVIGLVGIARDITAQKREAAERLSRLTQQRDALVREVHHRIKNHLQGVVGLLRQHQAQQPQVGPLLEEVIEQVRVIAEVYGLQGHRIDAPTGLRGLIDVVARCQAGARFVLPPAGLAAEAFLAVEETIPIALIINELVTNACKHRADPAGPVDIELEPLPAGMRLRVRAGPATLPAGFDFASAQGLGTGLQLVRTLLPAPGARLDYRQEQEDGTVVAELSLSAPVLLLPAR